jgi:hypothetical protein
MARPDSDWAGFRAWLHSVVVVTFDLELGQVIERTFPGRESEDVHPDDLSEQDRTNVCYLAFPDSNSGIMGDIQFHFRIREEKRNMRVSLLTLRNVCICDSGVWIPTFVIDIIITWFR